MFYNKCDESIAVNERVALVVLMHDITQNCSL